MKDIVTFTYGESWITLGGSGHQVLRVLSMWKTLHEEELRPPAHNQHCERIVLEADPPVPVKLAGEHNFSKHLD